MEKTETKTVKYPAPFLAHWVTGTVACCEEHCNQIVGLGEFTGSIVPVSENDDPEKQCENCVNEND